MFGTNLIALLNAPTCAGKIFDGVFIRRVAMIAGNFSHFVEMADAVESRRSDKNPVIIFENRQSSDGCARSLRDRLDTLPDDDSRAFELASLFDCFADGTDYDNFAFVIDNRAGDGIFVRDFIEGVNESVHKKIAPCRSATIVIIAS